MSDDLTMENLLKQVYERGYLDGARAVRDATITPPDFSGWLKERSLALAEEIMRND